MKFTLHISTDSKRKDIKERCCEILAEFLKKDGYFSVEFDPNEIDTDKLGKVMKANKAHYILIFKKNLLWFFESANANNEEFSKAIEDIENGLI